MNTKRQFLLGLFFLTALAILAFYTLFLTDFTLFGEPEKEMVYFEHANSLREGDPVLVAGMRVGRVRALTQDSRRPRDRRILAVLNLDEKVEIHEGYSIEIQESTMLGGRHVEIDPGPFDAPPAGRDGDGVLQGRVVPNPIEALGAVGELVRDNREAVQELLTKWNAISDEVAAAVTDVRAGKGVAGRIFMDDQLADDVAAGAANFRAVTADAKLISADIQAGKGVLGALLYDEDLKGSVAATIDDLRTMAGDLKAGRGTLGKLLVDEELAGEVDKGIRNLSLVAEGLEKGEGILGMLLQDEALQQDFLTIVADFKETSAGIREVADKVRTGEGSLGKLLASEELYDEALTAVKLLTRTLEDYREAAPVQAFTSVLFSGL